MVKKHIFYYYYHNLKLLNSNCLSDNMIPVAKVGLVSNNILCNAHLLYSLEEHERDLEVDPPGPSSPG